MDNPIDQINKLLAAIDKAIEEMGLSRATPGISIVPASENIPDVTLGITFKVNGNILTSSEQRTYDSEFDKLITGMVTESSDDKLKQLLEDWQQED